MLLAQGKLIKSEQADLALGLAIYLQALMQFHFVLH